MENDTKNKTLGQIAELIGAELIGDGSIQIDGINGLAKAEINEISFVSDEKYLGKIKESSAGAIITNKKPEGITVPMLLVKNVDAAVIEVLKIFAKETPLPQSGVHPSAVIESNVEIGQGTYIGPGCYVGWNSKIGSNSRLDANVVVYHDCRIGSDCVIQANTTIGAVGFGYSFIDGQHKLIPHISGVIIEDFVEIGANSCVDRAKFGNTIVGAGTKIDNLVQIAHNVIIGKGCLFASHIAIAGSSEIGNGVVVAGQAGIKDHIKIGDGVVIGAQAGVITDIASGQRVLGSPAIDDKETKRIVLTTMKLPQMAKQLKKLVRKVERLEAAENNK